MIVKDIKQKLLISVDWFNNYLLQNGYEFCAEVTENYAIFHFEHTTVLFHRFGEYTTIAFDDTIKDIYEVLKEL